MEMLIGFLTPTGMNFQEWGADTPIDIYDIFPTDFRMYDF